jgi:hypothetical protein
MEPQGVNTLDSHFAQTTPGASPSVLGQGNTGFSLAGAATGNFQMPADAAGAPVPQQMSPQQMQMQQQLLIQQQQQQAMAAAMALGVQPPPIQDGWGAGPLPDMSGGGGTAPLVSIPPPPQKLPDLLAEVVPMTDCSTTLALPMANVIQFLFALQLTQQAIAGLQPGVAAAAAPDKFQEVYRATPLPGSSSDIGPAIERLLGTPVVGSQRVFSLLHPTQRDILHQLVTRLASSADAFGKEGEFAIKLLQWLLRQFLPGADDAQHQTSATIMKAGDTLLPVGRMLYPDTMNPMVKQLRSAAEFENQTAQKHAARLKALALDPADGSPEKDAELLKARTSAACKAPKTTAIVLGVLFALACIVAIVLGVILTKRSAAGKKLGVVTPATSFGGGGDISGLPAFSAFGRSLGGGGPGALASGVGAGGGGAGTSGWTWPDHI